MRIVMLGAPGAGKGTQALKIVNEFKIPHVSTGDLFRSNIKGQTELGKKAQEYINRGELVPDELTLHMVLDRVAKEDCKYGYILDGFPRNKAQAKALSEALNAKGHMVDHAIDIEVPDDRLIERMTGRRVCPECGASFHMVHNLPKVEGKCDLCGAELITRSDDTLETVKKRLQVYHSQTEPLIEFYDTLGILRSIDGTQDMQKVFEEIAAILGE